MSLFVPLLVAVVLVAVQGGLLQLSCAVAGERPPAYGPALLTAIVAGLLSAIGASAFGWTIGLVLWFFSRTLAWAATGLFGIAISAAVYRSRLGAGGVPLSPGQAIAIAGIHHGLAWLVGGLAWWLVRYLPV